MNVLFYHTAKDWSGSSRAFAVAAQGLVAHGDTVTVACRADSPAEQAFASQGLEVVSLLITGSVSRDAWRLRNVMKERGTSVVFLHSEREQLVASSAMRLGARGTVVRRVPAGGTGGAGSRFAARMATSRLLFSTELDRSRVQAGEGALLAPLGVDIAKADEMRMTSRGTLGVEPGTQLMVCVADRKAKSRITTALRTVALLAPRHPQLRLALVGSGCDDDDTHMHASALGVTPLVRFLGERDDMAAVVGAAEVGWVAAEGDDGAFGCLDFMAAGVPVVAERTPLLSHYVPDGIAGVLLPPAHPNDTAATVANFLADNNQRVAMGKAGRNRAARDFTETAMIEGFIAAARAAGDRVVGAAR
jgi:hypothetical protein